MQAIQRISILVLCSFMGSQASGQAVEGMVSRPVLSEREAVQPQQANGDTDEKLTLADAIASVYSSFPEIVQARLNSNVARGSRIASLGAYDTKLQAHSLSEPTGFYRNYRNGLGIARQTWWGGYISAGYRLGRGDVQPWYKERETNEAGEYKLALGVPLLQGRAIDPQRVAVFQANLSESAAQPQVQAKILSVSLQAAQAYWQWVAAGGRFVAQGELLQLARERQSKFEVGEKAGKFAEIDLVFNRQLVAERNSKLLETEQKYRQASFKLSLFLRDELGTPLIANDNWLPEFFPVIESLPESDYNADLAAAIARRPEMALLNIESRRIQLDRRLAANQRLPTLNLISEASQDTGVAGSSIRDKSQFELMIGVLGEVPIQRRKAEGKILETSAKLAQMQQKMRLQQDKIGVELQSAYNALRIAEQMVEQAEIALTAAFDTLRRYEYAYTRGYADLIYLNLLETKANESEIKLVDAQRDWFIALAQMQTALGLDPLEQAMNLASLPPSKRVGPGHLPDEHKVAPQELEADWKRHSKPATAGDEE